MNMGKTEIEGIISGRQIIFRVGLLELPDVKLRIRDSQDGSKVAVAAAVVRCRKKSIDHWNVLPFRPHMLLVSFNLHFMGANNCNQLGLFQKVAGMLTAKEDRAVALIVRNVGLGGVNAAVLLLIRV